MRLLSLLSVLLLASFASAQKAIPVAPADAITVNVTTSSIDLNSVGANYNVTIKADYIASGPRGIIVGVYNENTGAWDGATGPGGAAAAVVAAGKGTVTFTYTIPKNTAWGKAIADGSFAQAWANANLSSFGGGPGAINLNDANWVVGK